MENPETKIFAGRALLSAGATHNQVYGRFVPAYTCQVRCTCHKSA